MSYPGSIPLLLAAALAQLFPFPLAGQQGTGDGEPSSRIEGRVVDAESGTAIVGAEVRVREVGRADLSHPDGAFHLENLAPGVYTLVIQALGYAGGEETVEVRPEAPAELRIELSASAISLPGIVVTGVGRERGVAESYRPTSVLAAAELERRLSSSLAGTLSREPGIAVQSFGPAPAQPVIRGMSGDRVLVLEDGHRTGDMASTSSDHAVGIDPLTAERIEVVRGPAGLLYGSNALGGVVNVIREEVPKARPEGMRGRGSLQAASVNRGVSAGGSLEAPLGRSFAVRGELSGRLGQDVRTPRGALHSTDSEGADIAAGASWLPDWGFTGVSYRSHLFDYGVPGEFGGESIPGAEAEGATLETGRHVGRFELGYFERFGPFSSIEADAGVIRYLHDEIEAEHEEGEHEEKPGHEESEHAGTSFDQTTFTTNVVARHEHPGGETLLGGAVGVFGRYETLDAGGEFPGVRDARRTNLAAYVYEELSIWRYRLQMGVRYDRYRVEPVDLTPIETGAEPLVPETRTFGDLSASVGILWELTEGVALGGSLARGFRAPSTGELFSAGPHLADFAYDIGNPSLGSETGLGLDGFVRVNRPGISLEVTAFRNRIRDFIHSRPTGGLDPRLGRFPLYLATSADAEFLGFEGAAQWEAGPGLVLDGTLSYVRAEYTGEGGSSAAAGMVARPAGEPLPRIPPLSGSVRARFETPRYFVEAGWLGAADQNRVAASIPDPARPGELIAPEEPTEGYALIELGGGVRWFEGERAHSITLTVENLLDTEWRNHLSRAKSVAPEPGRNIRLLYRVSF